MTDLPKGNMWNWRPTFEEFQAAAAKNRVSLNPANGFQYDQITKLVLKRTIFNFFSWKQACIDKMARDEQAFNALFETGVDIILHE